MIRRNGCKTVNKTLIFRSVLHLCTTLKACEPVKLHIEWKHSTFFRGKMRVNVFKMADLVLSLKQFVRKRVGRTTVKIRTRHAKHKCCERCWTRSNWRLSDLASSCQNGEDFPVWQTISLVNGHATECLCGNGRDEEKTEISWPQHQQDVFFQDSSNRRLLIDCTRRHLH